MLLWAIEIGRLDILLEVSLLSHHLALLREGHFGTGPVHIWVPEAAP